MPSTKKARTGTPNGSAATDPAGESVTLEEALHQLDTTVAQLESGQLPLEQSLALYERGIQLARQCQLILDRAELQVQQLRTLATPGPDGQELFVLESINIDTE